MIFGFNTDVKYGDVIYHVMTEARSDRQTIESTVFVRGQALGKKTSSYADAAAVAGFTEEQAHELLKGQHRRVVEAIRAGGVQEVLA